MQGRATDHPAQPTNLRADAILGGKSCRYFKPDYHY